MDEFAKALQDLFAQYGMNPAGYGVANSMTPELRDPWRASILTGGQPQFYPGGSAGSLNVLPGPVRQQNPWLAALTTLLAVQNNRRERQRVANMGVGGAPTATSRIAIPAADYIRGMPDYSGVGTVPSGRATSGPITWRYGGTGG